MERGIIDLVYEGENAIYYHLSNKISKEKILSKFLCNSEPREHVEKIFDYEQHWLAVWSNQPIERLVKGNTVEFEFSSTKFYENMRHKDIKLENIRNFNVTYLKKIL